MMMGKSWCAFWLAAALLAVSEPSWSANLLQNGSFENGLPIPAGGWVTADAPDFGATIANWDVTNNSVDYVGTFWQAADGTRSLDMNGSAAGTISQTFPTAAGSTYLVTFALAGAPGGVRHLRVSVAGKSEDYSFDAALHSWDDMGWVDKTFRFTAAASTTILQFQSLDEGYSGPALDNVRVSAVPPVPLLLLLD
jgi:choice-of-anchor C domain-containing protein